MTEQQESFESFLSRVQRQNLNRRYVAKRWILGAARESVGLSRDFARFPTPSDPDFIQPVAAVSCGMVKGWLGETALTKDSTGRFMLPGIFCKNVWVCPTCGPIIRWKKRQHVQELVEKHFENNGGAYLLTVTLQHFRKDKLKDLLKMLQEAWTKFQNTQGYRSRLPKDQLVGYVRASEIRYGTSGWHPHYHFLFLTPKQWLKVPTREFESWAKKAWQSSVISAGGFANLDNGFDFVDITRDGSEVGKYLTKIQENTKKVSAEMTRADNKKGFKSVAPFELLDDHIDWARELFVEYFYATKGRSTVRFSPGLKKHYGIDQKSDEHYFDEFLHHDLKLEDLEHWLSVQDIHDLEAAPDLLWKFMQETASSSPQLADTYLDLAKELNG